MFTWTVDTVVEVAFFAIVATFILVYLAIAITLAVAHEVKQWWRRLWQKK